MKSKVEENTKEKSEDTIEEGLKKKEKRKEIKITNASKKSEKKLVAIPQSTDQKYDHAVTGDRCVHNETFCRNWVQKSGNIQHDQAPSSQSLSECSNNDSASSSLLDVTSVSRNVPKSKDDNEEYFYSKRKKKTQVQEQLKKIQLLTCKYWKDPFFQIYFLKF